MQNSGSATAEPETLSRQLRRMRSIIEQVAKLDYAGRVWLMQRLVAEECGDVPLSQYVQPSPQALRTPGEV